MKNQLEESMDDSVTNGASRSFLSTSTLLV